MEVLIWRPKEGVAEMGCAGSDDPWKIIWL
jgi:hypothetical protein